MGLVDFIDGRKRTKEMAVLMADQAMMRKHELDLNATRGKT